ncbi:MAG: VWA domain-containing protein [Anaerolineae bacterium]
MTKRMFASLIVAFCLFSSMARAAQAQAPITPQVLSAVAQPGANSLGLDVYFVVTDTQGRPILNPNLEAATIQVVGGASAPVPASVGDPQSNIYVVLLIDVSGSMANVIGPVREAATSGLRSLPPNARVAVIAFDENRRVVNDFTGDLAEVGNRIQQVQVTPGGATCLYRRGLGRCRTVWI